MATAADFPAELAAIARADGGRLLAVLTNLLKNLDLAEECLQEAYASALSHWWRGIPANPSAWLLQVARRKAIDRLRRMTTVRSMQNQLAHLLQIEAFPPEQSDDAIPDERLKLIFTCCHPSIELNASVALTLRSLCGLTTDEIARAYLVSRETMAKRLVRAQQKIAKAGISYEVPDAPHWSERMESVLSVVYLIFNEGYASSTTDYIRHDLSEEAIRLARIVWHLAPQESEAGGLLALLLLQRSRFEARLDADGALVPLEFQDRSLWNRDLIAEATGLLQQVLRRGRAGPYQLQAAIAAIHCEAATFSETNWREVVMIYDRLLMLKNNAVVELNRLVAMSYIEDLTTVLKAVQALEPDLAQYQPYHAAKADILSRLGDSQGAKDALEITLSLSNSTAEKQFLLKRKAAL